MADENEVVGEIVTGRHIETEVVVHFVHGPELTPEGIAGLLMEALYKIEQCVGLTMGRSEEVVDRQTVTVSKPLPAAPGCWLNARGYECTAHGERPVDELDAWWGTDG